MTAESHLRRSEFPDRGVLVAIGLSALGLVGLAAQAGAESTASPSETQAWSHVAIVDASHAAGPVLQVAFHKVVATGIGGNAAAQVLKRLGEYVDSEVAQRGRAALSIGLIVDAAAAAKAGKWSADEMARLVIALHRTFDAERPQDWPRLQKVVERVRQGSRADEILAAGDTLREINKPAGAER
jgi:hypothetical protein